MYALHWQHLPLHVCAALGALATACIRCTGSTCHCMYALHHSLQVKGEAAEATSSSSASSESSSSDCDSENDLASPTLGSRGRNGGATDSLSKLVAVNKAACGIQGVVTGPLQLGGLLLAPLLSWHHRSWDREPDPPGLPHANRLTIAVWLWLKGLTAASLYLVHGSKRSSQNLLTDWAVGM
jgi:hypothetical protein